MLLIGHDGGRRRGTVTDPRPAADHLQTRTGGPAMRRVRFAVIPAAGIGTRMLPETRAVPKELFPVGGRPAIDFVLAEAFTAGVEEVIVVSSPRKPALRSYLGACGARDVADWHTDGGLPGGIVHVIDQPEPRGLGDAVRLARDALAGEAFAVLLPDELMLGRGDLLAEMLDVHVRSGRSVVSVMEVGEAEISSYGCVRPIAGPRDGTVLAEGFVEKPARDRAPSRLALTGRYVLDKDVLTHLTALQPESGGEIQLTSALNLAAQHAPLSCVTVRAEHRRVDVGNWSGWLDANELLFAQVSEGDDSPVATARSSPRRMISSGARPNPSGHRHQDTSLVTTGTTEPP